MRQTQEMRVWSLSREDPQEEGMATHSCFLVWRMPWTEELGRLQPTGSRCVRHSWAHRHTQNTRASLTTILAKSLVHRTGRPGRGCSLRMTLWSHDFMSIWIYVWVSQVLYPHMSWSPVGSLLNYMPWNCKAVCTHVCSSLQLDSKVCLFFSFFACTICLQDLNSLARDWTHALGSESEES